MPHFASKWARLRGKCLFLPDYGPLEYSFTTGAVRSAILATAGLLIELCKRTDRQTDAPTERL